jgi:nitrate reductase delta subunit
MDSFSILSEALRYPAPGRAEQLETLALDLPNGPILKAIACFLAALRPLSLGEWEELYTRTWDLDPLVAPYIGFQLWGEDYRRGNFMARLRLAYRATGIELDGELPDHLVPVLRYLAAAPAPLPELVEALAPAVEKMIAPLHRRDPANPYLILLNALPVSLRASVLCERSNLRDAIPSGENSEIASAKNGPRNDNQVNKD